MSGEPTIIYENVDPHVATIWLNRPESRNAQNTELLYALNDAFDKAALDDDIKVIILAAKGPHFSAGHDLREAPSVDQLFQSMRNYDTVGTWGGFENPGAEALMAREKEIYTGFSERWRNIPKPTIAAVQGKCIAGGLMLAWPCDIIIASEDAEFQDNTVLLGVGGVEYFAHPWELGTRKAKELLFTAEGLSAQEAKALGMVNHVVPSDELTDRCMSLARSIAEKPLFALKLAKEAVNNAEDAQGRATSMQTAFALHQLAHSHNMQRFGVPIDPQGVHASVKNKGSRKKE